MTVKKYILVACLFICLQHTYAEDGWYEGVAVLKDHSVINGELRLNPALNILQVKSDGKMLALPAFKVDLFYINDTQFNMVRKYLSMPYNFRNDLNADVFFEQVLNGKVKLLRKERSDFSVEDLTLERDVYTSSGILISDSKYQHVMSFNYFFKIGDRIFTSAHFEKIFLNGLNSEEFKKVDNFIAQNSLNINDLADQMQIIEFYNDDKLNKNRSGSLL